MMSVKDQRIYILCVQ